MKTNLETKNLLKSAGIVLAISLTPWSMCHAEVKNINLNQFGNTWGEWATRWAQWRFSFPTTSSQNENTSTPNCQLGQSGPVWFLSSFDKGDTHSCTVPYGKTIFLPAATNIAGAAVKSCEPTLPGLSCYVSTLRQAAADLSDRLTVTAFLDGSKLSNLNKTRVTSPEFSITMPADNNRNVPAGTYSPNVIDGYFIMLKSLNPGPHRLVINWNLDPAQAGYSGTTIYNLLIQK